MSYTASIKLAFYDLTNRRHTFAIHIIFKYLSLLLDLPTRNNDLSINQCYESPYPEDYLVTECPDNSTTTLGLKLYKGKLIK